MSSGFKKRLRRLHTSRSRQKAADKAGRQDRVFTADDVDVTDIGVPQDTDPLEDVDETWRAVGAKPRSTPAGQAFALRRGHRQNHQHGRARLVEATAVDLEKLVSAPATRLAFVDLETTGLSKTAYPFCVGVGLWEGTSFEVYHFFMTTESDEPAVLAAAAEAIASARGVCTFNGASFDLPMLARRFVHHEMDNPFSELPHLDLLPVARKQWPELDSHSLGHLESQVLDFERHDDVPGRAIPGRWQRYLDTGEPKHILGVFDHNRLDILSMAALLPQVATTQGTTTVSSAPGPAKNAPAKKSASRKRSQTREQPSKKPRTKIASKLSRSYALRSKSQQKSDEPATSKPRPASKESEPSEPERVELGGSFSRSKLRQGMPVGTRLRELRGRVDELLEAGQNEQVVGLLHEMVALAPKNPYALEKLIAHYRRAGDSALAAHFEKRLGETAPY